MARATKKPATAKPTKRDALRAGSKKPSKPARIAAPVVPRPPTAAQRLASDQASLDAAVARVWGSARHSLTIAGIEVRFQAMTGAKPHWQFLTAGLLKHGAELSFRVLRAKDELTPPGWLTTFWQSLIERAGTEALADGQVVRFAEKFGLGLTEIDTDMQGVALGLDPLLGVPQVLLAVGITRDEERLVREWSPRALLEVLARVDPSLITDLGRASTLVSPRTRMVIENRVAAEGSSLGVMLAISSTISGSPTAGWTWALSVEAVDTVVALLKGRIGHLRPFAVKAQDTVVELIPSDFPAVERVGDALIIKLSQPAARQVRATLKAKPGTYTFEALPKFTLTVVA